MQVPLLPFGRFLGSVTQAAVLGPFALVETVYVPSARLDRHRHEDANFCVVLEGGFRESSGGRLRECRAPAVLYRPPGEEHEQEFVATRSRVLNVDLSRRWLEEHRDHTATLTGAVDWRGTALPRLALRLHDELHRPDDLSALAAEGLLLEMIVESARASRRRAATQAPSWLVEVRSALDVRHREPWTLASLAALGGVHPAHLSRAFRRHFRASVADYLRDRRLDAAARALVETRDPISHIAADLGFADQSHLTRAFRRRFDTTPAAYRQRIAGSRRPTTLR